MLLQTPAAAASGAAEPECIGAHSAAPALQPILHATPQVVVPVSFIAQTCMHACSGLSTFVLLQLGTLPPGQRLLQGPATAALIKSELESREARSATPPVLPALHQLQPQALLCQNVEELAIPRNAASPAHVTALMVLPLWALAAQARRYEVHTAPLLFLACRQTAAQSTAAMHISKCTALLARLCAQASLPCHAMQALNLQHATGLS